jgi:hypothetical protein
MRIRSSQRRVFALRSAGESLHPGVGRQNGGTLTIREPGSLPVTGAGTYHCRRPVRLQRFGELCPCLGVIHSAPLLIPQLYSDWGNGASIECPFEVSEFTNYMSSDGFGHRGVTLPSALCCARFCGSRPMGRLCPTRAVGQTARGSTETLLPGRPARPPASTKSRRMPMITNTVRAGSKAYRHGCALPTVATVAYASGCAASGFTRIASRKSSASTR